MDRATESDLQVMPHASPEVVPQLYRDMFYVGGGVTNETASALQKQSDQSDTTEVKSQGKLKVTRMLAILAVLLLAAAIGAGLGAGLAVKHDSRPSRYTCLCDTILYKIGFNSYTDFFGR